jgi:hypothetical protein
VAPRGRAGQPPPPSPWAWPGRRQRLRQEAGQGELRWRNDGIGQAGLWLPESDTEIILSTNRGYEPNWLVESADAAADRVRAAGGSVLTEPFDIPVGRVAIVANPFDNVLVLLDLPKGRYTTDESGMVTGVGDDEQGTCRGRSPAWAGAARSVGAQRRRWDGFLPS